MALRKFWLVALTCLLSTNTWAGSMGTRSNFGEGSFVATLSIGPAWARPGEKQTVILQPDLIKTYSPIPTSRALKFVSVARGTETLAAGELFLGLRGCVNSIVEGQFGLVVGAGSQVKLQGSVFEDADPLFNNFSYSYGVRNSRVAAKAKFLYDTGVYDLYPYLSGSAGIGFNRASGFALKPNIIEEIPAPPFENRNETSFSYSIGLGLETALDPNWRLGLGYELVNWGRSALGSADGQRVGRGLVVKNLRAHEVLVSLSYVA
ncbi:MAG: porin family protein [Tatlockia sp.]|nr:porin family protein [Tatlockia sp.]